MRVDADEAARKLAAANIVLPWSLGWQGLARIVCGDLDGGDAFLQDAISIGELAPEIHALALSERSLVAMARHQWSQAGALATEAAAVLRRAGIEDSQATALVCAVRARIAIRRGDVPAARRELVNGQRLRHLLTYASPCLAVQARIEMTHVYLALADATGARTLMREIDDILRRRPGLGTLIGEAETLRARVAKAHGSSTPGASALTDAELRLLPLLSTHLTASEIAAVLSRSPHTIKAEMKSIYRKLDATSRNRAITRARELGLLEG
jgi:LuxR family maltose regulon positive regulatory protein